MLDAIMSMLGFLPDCGDWVDPSGACVTPDDGGTVTLFDGEVHTFRGRLLFGVMVGARMFWTMVV